MYEQIGRKKKKERSLLAHNYAHTEFDWHGSSLLCCRYHVIIMCTHSENPHEQPYMYSLSQPTLSRSCLWNTCHLTPIWLLTISIGLFISSLWQQPIYWRYVIGPLARLYTVSTKQVIHALLVPLSKKCSDSWHVNGHSRHTFVHTAFASNCRPVLIVIPHVFPLPFPSEQNSGLEGFLRQADLPAFSQISLSLSLFATVT